MQSNEIRGMILFLAVIGNNVVGQAVLQLLQPLIATSELSKTLVLCSKIVHNPREGCNEWRNVSEGISSAFMEYLSR